MAGEDVARAGRFVNHDVQSTWSVTWALVSVSGHSTSSIAGRRLPCSHRADRFFQLPSPMLGFGVKSRQMVTIKPDGLADSGDAFKSQQVNADFQISVKQLRETAWTASEAIVSGA